MSDKKELLEKGIDFVTPLISQWVLPKIKEILNNSTKKIEVKVKRTSHDFYKNKFENYLSNRYTKFFTLETLVFPNYPTLFDDLYYPLTISDFNGDLPSSLDDKHTKISEFVIDGFSDDFLPIHRRVLIQDNAGMGKSTILKKLFLSCLRDNKGIPVLIELRKLDKENSVFNEILNQLSSLSEPIEKDFLISLIERGDFIFFFDGLDEISFESRSEVLNDILSFIEKAGDNLFVISSRPENIVNSFKEFQRFTINELKIEEAFQLFKNYDQYSHKKIADDLTQILNTGQLGGVNEFLKNPFLSSLVYKTFSYKGDIPKQKEQFYRKVYDALYEEHDLNKEGYYKRDKYSGLGIDDFERILRCIGYKTMRLEKVELSKNQLLEIIKSAKKFCIGLEFEDSDFLKDLTNTVPLFKVEGVNNYKWVHKSYRDYFSARFIVCDTENKIDSIILSLLDERNVNTLDFISSMAPKKFKHTVLKCTINEFIEKYRIYAESHQTNEKEVKNYTGYLLYHNLYLGVFPLEDGDEDVSGDKLSGLLKEKYNVKSSGFTVSVRNEDYSLAIAYEIGNSNDYESIFILLRNNYKSLFVDTSQAKIDAESLTLDKNTWDFFLKVFPVNGIIKYDVDQFLKHYNDNKSASLDILRLGTLEGVWLRNTLDYEKCLTMKNDIAREIKEAEEADDFF